VDVREVDPKSRKVRGGSNLWSLSDGSYLAVVHNTHFEQIEYFDPTRFGMCTSRLRNYEHMFAKYDSFGKLVALSPGFQFIGYGVEFAIGLVVKGSDVIVSFGRNDIASYLAKISLEKVLEMLEEV
jgi:hypothetical protein